MGPNVSLPFWQVSITNRTLTARKQDGIDAWEVVADNIII